MMEASNIVHVQVTKPAGPIATFRFYRITQPLRDRMTSQGVTISPADEEQGYALLKVPVDLEALYWELSLGDVREA